MQTSFQSYRYLATTFKVLGYICLVMFIAITVRLFSVPVPYDWSSEVSAALWNNFLVFVILIVLLFAISALITLLCDIADNTKRSADALENKTE